MSGSFVIRPAEPEDARDIADIHTLLDDMRLVKDAHELATMRRAAAISTGAHVRAMRVARPGGTEYAIEAELLHEFRRLGAQSPAYTSIVAAGACSLVAPLRRETSGGRSPTRMRPPSARIAARCSTFSS